MVDVSALVLPALGLLPSGVCAGVAVFGWCGWLVVAGFAAFGSEEVAECVVVGPAALPAPEVGGKCRADLFVGVSHDEFDPVVEYFGVVAPGWDGWFHPFFDADEHATGFVFRGFEHGYLLCSELKLLLRLAHAVNHLKNVL